MCSTSLQCYKYNSALHLAYFGKNCRYQNAPTLPPLKFFKFGHRYTISDNILVELYLHLSKDHIYQFINFIWKKFRFPPI